MEISPLEWDGEALCILDQTKLPGERIYFKARAWREVVRSIRAMQVRGAPAIGIAGAFAVALASGEIPTDSIISLRKRLAAIGEQIACARPTAVNLQWAVSRMIAVAEECTTTGLIQKRLIFEAELILHEDVAANRRIGAAGAPFIPDGGAVLTHCNAGALATGGYGTLYRGTLNGKSIALKVPLQTSSPTPNEIVDIYAENIIHAELFCYLRTLNYMKHRASIPKPIFFTKYFFQAGYRRVLGMEELTGSLSQWMGNLHTFGAQAEQLFIKIYVL